MHDEVHAHTYRTRLRWEGSTGVGYDHYDRSHRLWALAAPGAGTADGPDPLVASGGPEGLRLSSDPSFLGDPNLLNPEQLLLAAASSCHFLSFVAIAARKRLDVVAYADDASAVMPTADRPVRITRIVLRPQVTFRQAGTVAPITAESVAALHDKAHHACFIANSLTSDIVVEPTFTVSG